MPKTKANNFYVLMEMSRLGANSERVNRFMSALKKLECDCGGKKQVIEEIQRFFKDNASWRRYNKHIYNILFEIIQSIPRLDLEDVNDVRSMMKIIYTLFTLYSN